MRSKVFKAATVAVALAAVLSAPAYADDNSMSIWTGDSYRAFNGGQNFPNGNPVTDRAPSTFLANNPGGLTNAEYAALSKGGWLLTSPTPRNPEAERVASEQAREWRRENPNGLTEREYQALSSSSSIWQLPDATSPGAMAQSEPTLTAAQLRERFARFFRGSQSSIN